ncbi:FUSC family protein, partial [Pseudomonas sp. K5002]
QACYAESMPWRLAIRAMGRALVRLFVKPGPGYLQRALEAVEHAIECVQQTDEPFAGNFETSALRRVESYLHFIRTSLLDPQSPLVHYNQPGEKVAQSSD